MATSSSALTALEPFIILSKSAISPRAAADLIQRATSHPQTYVFTELLSTPNIQALRSGPPEFQSSLTHLEIFSWGTHADYQSLYHLFLSEFEAFAEPESRCQKPSPTKHTTRAQTPLLNTPISSTNTE